MSFPSTRHSLIARCTSGDEAAWDEFFRAYFEPSVAFVLGLRLGQQDAEDVVQEALLKAWTSGLQYHRQEGARFRSFLMEILRRRMLDFEKYEGRQRRDVRKTVAGDVPVSAELPDLGTVLEQVKDPTVLHPVRTPKAVEEALTARLRPSLNEAELRAYLDWFWHGDDETEEEIARRHEISVSQLRYAREKAGRRLGGICSES